MEPIDMPIIAGAIIVDRFASIAIIGSSGVSPDPGRWLSEVARSVNNGRMSVRVRCAQRARVVVRISECVSRGPVDRFVTPRTCMSAMSARAL